MKTWVMRFRYAFNGLTFSFNAEASIRIHFFATIAVIGLSIVKNVGVTEAIVLSLTIGSVWAAELFNTAIEKLADKVCPGYNEQIKIIKDLSAAAVLVTATTAMVTGLIIFIPKFI